MKSRNGIINMLINTETCFQKFLEELEQIIEHG